MKLIGCEKICDTKDLTTEDWLRYRKSQLGGSDAATALGLNPWTSRIDLWKDKTNPDALEEKESEALRIGHDLEDYVAKRFEEATGKKVRRRNAMLRSIEWPFMAADLDFEVVGEDAILECKTANAYGRGKWVDGDSPLQYQLQCHHYMAVTGAKKVYLACLIMGIDFVIVEINRDEEVIDMLVKGESEFWHEYVEKGIMPPPSGSKNDGAAISDAYPFSVEASEIVLDAKEGALSRMDEIDSLIDELTTEKERLKQEIQTAMGENETAYVGDRVIKWKSVKGRETLDTKSFKADHPDLYEQYKKVGAAGRRFSYK